MPVLRAGVGGTQLRSKKRREEKRRKRNKKQEGGRKGMEAGAQRALNALLRREREQHTL